MKKIIVLLIFMVVLSYLGEKISGHLHQFQTATFASSLKLVINNLPFIIVSNFFFYLLEMLRLNLIGRVFNLRFTWGDCFGGIALNILFAWITPVAILGAPALAYFLYKKGHPLVESISVAFIRSFSIIVVSALTTIGIYSFNLQGAMENIVLQEKVFQVLVGITIYISALVMFSYLPFEFIKKIKFLNQVTSQIRIFISKGRFLILPILALGLILNFLFVSLVVYLGAGFYPSLGPLISQSMLFLSYLLLMPTPGASGLAELGAPLFFSQAIPAEQIVSIVTALRLSSIGLQVSVGIIFMLFIFKNELTITQLQKFKKNSEI